MKLHEMMQFKSKIERLITSVCTNKQKPGAYVSGFFHAHAAGGGKHAFLTSPGMYAIPGKDGVHPGPVPSRYSDKIEPMSGGGEYCLTFNFI